MFLQSDGPHLYEICGFGESPPHPSALPPARYVIPMRRRLIFFLCLLAAACLRPDVEADAGVPALALERTPERSGTHLRVVAPEGIKLSAAIKPELRLESGVVVRFDTTAISADSLYFTAPPAAWVDAPDAEIRGLLKAGICDEVTATCRRVTVEI